MSDIDVDAVTRAMDSLPEVLEHEELAVLRTLPRLAPADVLDTALRRSLAKLRFELNQASFEYLRWKVALTRAEHERLRGTIALRRGAPPPADAPTSSDRPSSERRARSRSFTSEDGVVWTAAVIHTLTPTDPAHASCLVFSSEQSVRYRWQYPSNWLELSDRALDDLRLDR